MKKGGRKKSSNYKKIRWMRWVSIVLIILIVLMIISTFFTSKNVGNVALIKVNGVITGNGGGSYLTGSTISSQEIVAFIGHLPCLSSWRTFFRKTTVVIVIEDFH